MILEELLSQLDSLSRADKLEVLQILVNELALEEAGLMSGSQYDVWSPYDSAGAAKTLTMLHAENRRTDH
jgi:hypothetical protein